METALCLAGREELVLLQAHRPPVVDRFEQRYQQYGEVFLFREMTDTGALGDAGSATAEGGEHVWREITGRLARMFVELAALDGATIVT
jgi:hypothetical protein